MTVVVVRRDEEGVRSLTVSGHAGYADGGEDVVCAAVSVLVNTCANAIESVVGKPPLVETDERIARFFIGLPSGLSPALAHDVQVIFLTILQGLRDVAEAYPRYVQIKEQ